MKKNKFKIDDSIFLIHKNQIIYGHVVSIQSYTTAGYEEHPTYKYHINCIKKLVDEIRLFKSLKDLLQYYVDNIEEDIEIGTPINTIKIKTYFK